MKRKLAALGLVLAIYAPFTLSAQNRTTPEIAIAYLHTHAAEMHLSEQDVADVVLTDFYQTAHNGVAHAWFVQQYRGIPVYNAYLGLHFGPDGQVYRPAHRMHRNLAEKINTDLPGLSARRALQIAIEQAGLEAPANLRLLEKKDLRQYVFDAGDWSARPIPVSACYQPMPDGALHLAWNVEIEANGPANKYWTARIDALTGEQIGYSNRIVSCDFDPLSRSAQPVAGEWLPDEKLPAVPESASAAYRVFALPTESPAHGDRVLLLDPADPTASPFGWHDTDGAPGAEYTYTRGNNVWAYDDIQNGNSPSEQESAEGGPALVFDFALDPNAEPVTNREASVTNLFYACNRMHDIFYHYGFDEPAGNYQVNNYGNGGAGNDPVLAEAIDGNGFNNANFSLDPDGFSSRMQMYRWGLSGQIVRVNAPLAASGLYPGQPALGWGAPVTTTPVTGQVLVVNDGSGEPTHGCDPTPQDMTGKIAMVDRGTCQYSQKALNVQEAGAIACIVCNYDDGLAQMSAGNFGFEVNIPVVMMGITHCNTLKQYANAGLDISLVVPDVGGPEYLDGDFDNGIVTHEYAHGISNRLTAGPSGAECLLNPEQMGEGWSDFIALAVTARQGDTGAKPRGLGTYIYRQDNDGTGIRRYPYSTDMAINPITFGTVALNPRKHPLGEVWTAVLWDLYWAMVEKYGFDPDVTNTASGNGRAVQLVIDGLKMQPCNPGFIDGRDAILAADVMNYQGADTCLIMDVFARRGLGYLAEQGSSQSAIDGVENFDPIPQCLKTLKINKYTQTPTINPGDTVLVSLEIANHKDTPAEGVVVSDELPEGLQLLTASDNGFEQNGMVVWNAGILAPGEERTLQYAAVSDPQKSSSLLFKDPLEDDFRWLSIWVVGQGGFFPQNQDVIEGDVAWKAPALAQSTDVRLEYSEAPIPVSGVAPALRFWHRYDTEKGADAGMVEVRRANETLWTRLEKTDGFRNTYNSNIQYLTFTLPFLSGFSGNSGDWEQSYFDLSEFAGDSVLFRFRFGTDAQTGGDGWIVDAVEIIDLFNYQGTACISDGSGDQACAELPERGVIVNPGGMVNASTPEVSDAGWLLYPNPVTGGALTLSHSQGVKGQTSLRLFTLDGRLVRAAEVEGIASYQTVTMNVAGLPGGMYVLQAMSESGMWQQKVVLR